METNYYTPDRSEFCEGLDYEAYIPHRKCWSEETFFLNQSHLDTIKFSETRVKRLDKSDIEDCGWEYDNNAEPYPGRVPYDLPIGFAIDKQLETGELWMLYLYPKDQTVWIEFIKGCAGEGYVFKGIVNNKHELKRIMKQLGIC